MDEASARTALLHDWVYRWHAEHPETNRQLASLPFCGWSGCRNRTRNGRCLRHIGATAWRPPVEVPEPDPEPIAKLIAETPIELCLDPRCGAPAGPTSALFCEEHAAA